MAKKNIISLKHSLLESGFTNAQIDEVERAISDGMMEVACSNARLEFMNLFSMTRAKSRKSIILRVHKKKRFSERLYYFSKTNSGLNGINLEEDKADEE